MRLLVVEDDRLVVRALELLFANSTYSVDTASDAETALQMVEAFEYDLIVLDILLPGMNGIDLCHHLRDQGYQMPILLLTGQGNHQQKAIALNSGADDYVVKPFDPEELVARVQALLRRGGAIAQPVLAWRDLKLDPNSHTVAYGVEPLSLTPKEFAILELFLRNKDRTLSSKALLDHAWTATENPGEETVRVHIKQLRKKLGAAGAPADFIETLYRVGYRLRPVEVLASPIRAAPEAARLDGKAPSMGEMNPETVPILILLATVQPDLVTQLRALLNPQHLQLAVLPDLEQFWPVLVSCQPGLVILDYDLPAGRSFELCQRLRQTSPWQNLPIIFLIPTKDVSIVNQIFAAGANDFVSQPIAGPELITRIRICLGY